MLGHRDPIALNLMVCFLYGILMRQAFWIPTLWSILLNFLHVEKRLMILKNFSDKCYIYSYLEKKNLKLAGEVAQYGKVFAACGGSSGCNPQKQLKTTRRQLTSKCCPLTFTWVLWQVYIHTPH